MIARPAEVIGAPLWEVEWGAATALQFENLLTI